VGLMALKSWRERVKLTFWTCPEHAEELAPPGLVSHEEDLYVYLPTEELAEKARADVIAARRRETRLITAAIATGIFTDHLCPESGGHFRSPVRRAVIDHDHLVDKLRHAGQYLFDALFFVQARHDHRDRLSLIHSTVSPA